jgi:hypothetical protein
MNLKIRSGGRFFIGLVAFVAVASSHGCASRETIVTNPHRRIQLPQSGELEVQAQALVPVGSVLPVYISVKNLAPRARTFKQPGVFGITDAGERILELSLDDPSVVTNGEGLFMEVAGGRSAMSELLAENTLPWPMVVAGGPGLWTAFAVHWAMKSASSPSERLADYRLEALKSSEKPNLEQGIEYRGYVFFPNRHYATIEFTVLNTLTGNDEFIRVPVVFCGSDCPRVSNEPVVRW